MTSGPRAIIAIIVGVGSAVASMQIGPYRPGATSDLRWAWEGARALLHGLDPYTSIGAEGPLPGIAPNLWYPMPAVVVCMPLARLPLAVANAVFVGVSGAFLAWALSRSVDGAHRLFVFGSAAWFVVLQNAQWSGLITAAGLVPSLGFLLACKPSLGGALMVAYPSRRSVWGAALFVLVTVVIWPWWIPEWLASLRTAEHIKAPVTRFGGPLILLALLKWRRPEARLLAVLACAPQTPNVYEAVPLFLIPATWIESSALLVLTGIVYYRVQTAAGLFPDMMAYLDATGQAMLIALYVPCLVMVLLRPNQGPEKDESMAVLA